jgi:adenosylcobinamide-phosphate synthase
LTAAVVIGLAPVLGGRSGSTARVVARDAGRHPSPNAGPVEAAFAGALGLTLGGVNIYGDAVEDRGILGAGPSPRPADIARATRLSAAVGGVVALLAVGAAGVVCRRGPSMAADR